MNMVLLSSLVVLFAIASMVAIAPGAFAMHHEATVTNAPGSSTPGCEDTADGCFIPSPVTINVGGIVTGRIMILQLTQQLVVQQLKDQVVCLIAA